MTSRQNLIIFSPLGVSRYPASDFADTQIRGIARNYPVSVSRKRAFLLPKHKTFG